MGMLTVDYNICGLFGLQVNRVTLDHSFLFGCLGLGEVTQVVFVYFNCAHG